MRNPKHPNKTINLFSIFAGTQTLKEHLKAQYLSRQTHSREGNRLNPKLTFK